MKIHTTVLLLACALLFGGTARAEDYPSRSIRLIVPFAAGGAGGIIGMDAVAKAAPDGYTLLLAHSGITYMPGLYRKLPFDPVTDFDGIITAVSGTYVLAVTNSLPFKTVAELVAYAKANPGRLSYGSAGVGSTLHLAAEFFKRAAGIDAVHVPYKGAAQATTDLIGGQLQMMFGPAVAIMPLARAGSVRALAVTSARRSALAPELPTMSESGVPGFEVAGWYGLAAPAGTPKDIIQKLNIIANNALASPDLIEQFRLQGYEPVGGTPEDMNALIKTDVARWTKIIRDAAIEPQ